MSPALGFTFLSTTIMPSPVQTQLPDMSGNMSGDSVVPNDMDPSAGSRFCISGPKGCANLRAETEFLPDNPRCSYCRHTSASSRTTRKKPQTTSDPFPKLTELAASYRVPEGSDLIWCVGIDHQGARPTPSCEFRPREPYPCEDHRGAQSWRIRRDILCDACRDNRDPVTGRLVSGVYPIAQVHYMPTDYFGLTRSKKMDWWYLAIRRAGLRRDPRVMMAQEGSRVLGYEEVLGNGKELGHQQQQQQQHELTQDEDTMMTDANASSIFSSAASPSTCFTTPIKQQGGFEEINLDDIDAYTDEQWNATLAVMDEGLAHIEVGFNGGLFEYTVKQQSDFGLAVPVLAGQQQMQNATGAWEMPEHDSELAQLASLQAYVQCSDQGPELKPEPQGAQEADLSIHSDGPSLFIKDEVTSPPAQLVTPKDNNNTGLFAAADDDDDGDNLPLKRTQAPARVKRIIESLLSEDMGLVCTTCGELGRVELLFRGFVMSDYDAALRPDWRQCLCCFEANPRP